MGKGEGNTHLTTDRTRHYRDCPECGGDGRVAFNLHEGDPQWDDDEDCPACIDGEVTEWTDPLVLLRLARPWRGIHYRRARLAAMARSLHTLAQRESDLNVVAAYRATLEAA